MHCITADYPAEWKEARVYILSDLHIGDPNADMNIVHDRINQIAEDPCGLCILNGDIMNTAIRKSVSDVYAEIMSPTEQIKMAGDLLKPIRKKIVGADTGNHEYRVYKNDGIDMMRFLCRDLGIEEKYAPEAILVFLRFGSKPSGERSGGRNKQKMIYSIYATHGTGGGRKEGAKAIRLADMAGIVDADCYIHSHSHLPMVMKEVFFRVDVQNQQVRAVDKLFVNDAATLTYGGYGQAAEYKPMSLGSPVIHLSGTAKNMRGIL